MNLKKLSKMTGCLVLSGALVLQTPGMVFAAERITDINTDRIPHRVRNDYADRNRIGE